jgi:L-amino acid N-acyltransferase YncA
MSTIVRDSTDADLPALAAIYQHSVRTGTASFETEPPSTEEFGRRRATILAAGFPYLVAESAGELVGYTYAGTYRPRPGYRFTIENSVYVRVDQQGRGIGKALLPVLIERCEQAGFRLMIAVIGDTDNHPSINLHRSCGFTHVGTLPAVGWKFGRWLDSVLMTRPLGPGATTPPPPDR